MSSQALLDEVNRQWRAVRRETEQLRRRVGRVEVRERAEVAAGVPVYATVGDLPPAGQLGRLAAVAADGSLRFDNGTSWVRVTTA